MRPTPKTVSAQVITARRREKFCRETTLSYITACVAYNLSPQRQLRFVLICRAVPLRGRGDLSI